MRAIEFLSELSYKGNIGIMELVKFQEIATPEQKILMKELLAKKKKKQALELLKKVTGVELKEEPNAPGVKKISLNQLYNGEFPDRDETFWDYVRPDEFDIPLTIHTMPKHKLQIMLLGQYRIEHIDELTDMMDRDQQKVLQNYIKNPALSNKIILICDDRVIDGNHRALAAVIKGVPINYIDLAELEEQVDEDVIKISSNTKAKNFIQKVYEKYPATWQNNHVMVWGEGDDQQFAMFELEPSLVKPNAVEVKWFQAYPLRQGVGSRAMQELQRLAKEDGVTLTLFPWDRGRISQAKLIKFYKKHGYQPVIKGSKSMYWSPESTPTTEMQSVMESTSGVTPAGYTWSFEQGSEVPYKSGVEVNTFIRVQDSKGKTVLGVWADVYGDNIEIQYSEVFDKKLRGKGIYTDFLQGLAKHYNIISDQDQNNAARNIYKKLGADYNPRSEKHTLRRSSQSVAEGGAETSWSDENEKITLQDILELTKHIKQINLPINDNLKSKLIHWDGNPEEIERINQVTVSNQFPILVMVDEQGQINWILDGNHRLHKAIRSQAKTIPAKLIKPSDLNDKAKRIFRIKEQGVAEDNVDEMALSTYKTMGDFSKPGPFTGADKKLVPHPKNIEKATRFFEQTPFDFRLFFSHLKGTGKYSEYGPMSHDQIRQIFGQDAEEIINGSEDAITVVYVGNKGDSKVMLTPWMMAHRFGHAVNRGVYKAGSVGAWAEAEKHFFTTINNLLNEYYGKVDKFPDSGYGRPKSERMNFNLTPEYNALFNAIGTQRSSRSGEIRRPYEFFYELFAQYLGTGKVTLNPFPTNLAYGRKAWGNPARFMNIKPEYRDEAERRQAAEMLSRDMEILFNDVLGDSVGKIFVM